MAIGTRLMFGNRDGAMVGVRLNAKEKTMNFGRDHREQLYSTNGAVKSETERSSSLDEVADRPGIRSALYDPPKSTVDPRATFDGKYNSESDLLVQGKLFGEIACRGTLIIDADAEVKAKVEAAAATILGTYDGDLVCSGKLTIGATASVRGSVKTVLLVIEEGATVRAKIDTVADGGAIGVEGRRKDTRPTPIARMPEIGTSIGMASAVEHG